MRLLNTRTACWEASIFNMLHVCVGCFSFLPPLIQPHQFPFLLNYSSFLMFLVHFSLFGINVNGCHLLSFYYYLSMEGVEAVLKICSSPGQLGCKGKSICTDSYNWICFVSNCYEFEYVMYFSSFGCMSSFSMKAMQSIMHEAPRFSFPSSFIQFKGSNISMFEQFVMSSLSVCFTFRLNLSRSVFSTSDSSSYSKSLWVCVCVFLRQDQHILSISMSI